MREINIVLQNKKNMLQNTEILSASKLVHFSNAFSNNSLIIEKSGHRIRKGIKKIEIYINNIEI